MVAILLSTYNGEKYIEEQVNSIIEQTYKDWILYIRDDGSSDNTVEIIKSLATGDNRIKLVEACKDNLRVAKSFMYLLEIANADYYMFCDQDDYWLPTKIQETLSKMKEMESLHGSSCPIIAFSDLLVVDQKLNVLEDSFYKHCGTTDIVTNERFFYTGPMTPGCVMMLNESAKQVCLPFEQVGDVIHDYWVMLRVLKHEGHLCLLNKPLMKYRQHEKNVIGAAFDRGSFLNRLKSIQTTFEKNKKIFQNAHNIGGISIGEYIFLKFKTIFLFKRV